jgi:hypothetical protein
LLIGPQIIHPNFMVSCATHLGSFGSDKVSAQVAVVIPTILRSTLLRCVQSVFEQSGLHKIHLLVGVDVARGPIEPLFSLLQERPPSVCASVLQLPWSTSAGNGGIHSALDGGSLRAILSLMANARYVAYLDDDNSWLTNHLASLMRAINGNSWAFSLRWLVDDETDERLAVDRWDSVGPDKGRFAAAGGFVDPNCLLIDKVACAHALGRWCETGTGKAGVTADRHFFAGIRHQPSNCSGEATVIYRIRKTNIMRKFIRGEERARQAYTFL